MLCKLLKYMLINCLKVISNLVDEKMCVVDVFLVNYFVMLLYINGFFFNKEIFGYEYNLVIGLKGLISNCYIFVIFLLDCCNFCNECF